MQRFLTKIDAALVAIPWALILLVAFVIYAVIARVGGPLSDPEFIDAFAGAGLLAIGHGVHEHARIRSRRD
jgi:hypothetical protein